jgi:hypothetical protein
VGSQFCHIAARALVVALLYGSSLVLATESEFSETEQTNETPAVEERDSSQNEEDGESREASNRYRLLPIPIIITEPAIGKGLGVALAVFHPLKSGAADLPKAATPTSIDHMDDSRQPPPVVSAAFGAYTSSDTWIAGVGHFNNWREDRIRYAGALAGARINSEFYVLGFPIGFSMEGVMVYQDVKFRLGRSDFFLGTALSYMDADNEFGLKPDEVVPEPLLDFAIKNVGLALRGSYDTRDNVMNPFSGLLTELSVWRYDEAIGGNYDYWSGKLKALSFHHFHDRYTLGLRLEVSAVDGRPPFFGYPWVKLRGIPAMRYQNKVAGALEVEGRYLLAPRWELSAFAGKGFTSDDVPFFDNPGNIYNFGAGLRYNIFTEHRVWAGIDVAKGPEDWAWYIQVGHPW